MTRNILSPRAATRRKLLKFGAAASVLPWVHIRTAGAAGQVSMFLWDHWVPAGNVELKRQIAAFADKNKVEVKADFITSQGGQLLLTQNAEAQAKVGHDAIHIGNWNVQDHAHLLEPMDDVVGRLSAKYGNPDGPTFEQLFDRAMAKGLTDEQAYERIRSSATATDEATNRRFSQ